MCLIVHVPREKSFNESDFQTAFYTNGDGAGVMWVEDGRVQVRKNPSPEAFEDVRSLVNGLENKQHVIHLRYATSGNKDRPNTHPFCILNKNAHGRDLYMVHNGVMSFVKRPNARNSDTWHFVENYLRPILSLNPSLIYKAEFQEMLKSTIGTTNKLLFLDDTGNTIIINKSAGAERNGIWLSNSYSTETSRAAWKGTRHSRAEDNDPEYQEWLKKNKPTSAGTYDHTQYNYGRNYGNNSPTTSQYSTSASFKEILSFLCYIITGKNRTGHRLVTIQAALDRRYVNTIILDKKDTKQVRYILSDSGKLAVKNNLKDLPTYLQDQVAPALGVDPQETFSKTVDSASMKVQPAPETTPKIVKPEATDYEDEFEDKDEPATAATGLDIYDNPTEDILARLTRAKSGKGVFSFCIADFEHFDSSTVVSDAVLDALAKEPLAAADFILRLINEIDEMDEETQDYKRAYEECNKELKAIRTIQ